MRRNASYQARNIADNGAAVANCLTYWEKRVVYYKTARLLSKGNLFCRRLLIFLEFLIDNLLHALAFLV